MRILYRQSSEMELHIQKIEWDTWLTSKNTLETFWDVGSSGSGRFHHNEPVRIIRTDEDRKSPQNHRIRTEIIPEHQRTICSNYLAALKWNRTTIPLGFWFKPFFSRFGNFRTTYARNRPGRSLSWHPTLAIIPGIDGIYITWADVKILYKNIEKQKS